MTNEIKTSGFFFSLLLWIIEIWDANVGKRTKDKHKWMKKKKQELNLGSIEKDSNQLVENGYVSLFTISNLSINVNNSCAERRIWNFEHREKS